MGFYKPFLFPAYDLAAGWYPAGLGSKLHRPQALSRRSAPLLRLPSIYDNAAASDQRFVSLGGPGGRARSSSPCQPAKLVSLLPDTTVLQRHCRASNLYCRGRGSKSGAAAASRRKAVLLPTYLPTYIGYLLVEYLPRVLLFQ
jgi:hypothetical protein